MNIKKVTVPILVMHGTEDKVINCDHARKLASLANQKLVLSNFIEDAGHNDIESKHFSEFKTTLSNFFKILFEHDYEQNLELKPKSNQSSFGSFGFSVDD